jgi:hypothetical protein
MKYSIIILGVLLSVVSIIACHQGDQGNKKELESKAETDSGGSSCEKVPETTLYPNPTKPMALMMRTMVDNAQSMREQVIRSEPLDSLKYPFIRFYLAEPTDSSVLEPVFFENARLFQQSYQLLFQHPDKQLMYYNAMIGKCINCHEHYCNGPLKRIRKLLIVN